MKFKFILTSLSLTLLTLSFAGINSHAVDYSDIGLRLKTSEKVIPVSIEPSGTLTSPFRISKNGTTYGISLVETNDLSASPVRIQTSAGIKSIRELTDPSAFGTCGSADGSSFSFPPSTDLCAAGNSSAVTTNDNTYIWSCVGIDTTANCSATREINGVCGSAHDLAVTNPPTSNLCSIGTASSVSGIGPWTWTCAGSSGGTTADCNAPVLYTGNDSYTKLLLHMDGANDGTTFTDSSASNHSATRYNVLTKTAVTKFGTASGYFDGVGDYLKYSDSADWQFGAGDFTIDFWAYPTGYAHSFGTLSIVSQWNQDVNNSSFNVVLNPKNSSFYINLGRASDGESTLGEGFNVTGTGIAELNVWRHYAVVRNGNNITFYVDGVDRGGGTLSAVTTLYNSSRDLTIGKVTNRTYDFMGYLDDVRISKGIARWTSNFTPSAVPYGP